MPDSKPLGKIAIVGGGISGVTLAIALLHRGLDVDIFEQAAHFGEIGAGVAFNPAAARAMKICSSDVYDAFEKVATRNQGEDKQSVWFDWVDAHNDTEVGKQEYAFSISNEFGANAVHRAHFLDELVKHVPDGVTHFGKHLDTIEELEDGKLKLRFHDGTDTTADAVYTHKYAYRGLIPMDKARKELGDDLAQNAKMHMGQDGHVLTFPVNKGATMNVVAFKVDPGQWPSDTKLTLPSEKSHVYKDFEDFGATVHKIIDMLEPNLDCWAIYGKTEPEGTPGGERNKTDASTDTGDHPMPYYNKGRVVVVGDAGHATSPHHGAGAGMCIEDSAIMAELLNDPRVAEAGHKGFDAAFQAYSEQRLERTQWLVQSSRRSGDLYEWRAEGVGKDFEKIEEECRSRDEKLWNGQVKDYIEEAKTLLTKHLKFLARSARPLSQAVESRVPFSFRTAQQGRAVAAVRNYSAAPETGAKENDVAAENAEKAAEGAKEDPTLKELEAKKKEVADVTDKWKRQIAEYRNLQEQTKREVRAAKDFALQSFSRDLLDSIDNLDRALSVVPKEKLDGSNKDLLDLHSGLKMTETILMNTLKKHGLERFDPSAESDKFDPNMHEATFQTPQPDKQDGTVFFCQSKGFTLNGRVIRPAKVGVVRNS
ncbi:putative salicylate hydroxylase [Aureobasidium subglaciale]|nr:putative salicylate hydroxylase [Aureobasidium subglaciale]